MAHGLCSSSDGRAARRKERERNGHAERQEISALPAFDEAQQGVFIYNMVRGQYIQVLLREPEQGAQMGKGKGGEHKVDPAGNRLCGKDGEENNEPWAFRGGAH